MLVAIKPLSATCARFAVTRRRTYAVFDGYARWMDDTLGQQPHADRPEAREGTTDALLALLEKRVGGVGRHEKPNDPRVLARVICVVAMLGATAFLMLR